MKIFFGGAEKGTHRSMLVSANVQRYALNLTHFNIPKRKILTLPEMFNHGEVLLYTSENDEDIHRFDEFLRQHSDELTLIVGRPDYDGNWLGDKYIPVWNDGDLERLAHLCQRYGRVAISDKAITPAIVNRINGLIQRWSVKAVGLTSKPDFIEGIQWDTVVVGSWTSAIRYGETQVWDGHGLRRYPAQQKDSSRKRHKADIERLGIQYESLMDDEVEAVGMLAIRSWQAYESRVFGAYDPTNEVTNMNDNDDENDDIIIMSPPTPTTPNAVSGYPSIITPQPEKRHESERLLLPVMGVETITSIGSQIVDNEGESIELQPEKVNVLRYNADPLRQCDNCYLASRCPSFKEHSECAFKLPIEIRTKDQLQAALRAIVEMQLGRVMFARFAEELEGQGLDSSLSTEMDRVFDLIEKFKNISDTRDLVRFEVEARGSSGVLSRLFGTKAGETAKQLPNGGLSPSATDAMYSEIIDLGEQQ